MNVSVFFDVLLAGTCLPPAYYVVRTLLQICHVKELSILKQEWIPVCLAGIFFASWVIEGAYFDYEGEFSLQANWIRDATLFASVSVFAFGAARFAETWGGYVKGVELKKKMQVQPFAETVMVPSRPEED